MGVMAADAIVPDTKDWTWTAERRCAECGVDASAVTAADLPALVHTLTGPWGEVLARPDVVTRARPDRWSPLEYACHIGEVLEVFAERFALILQENNPTLPNWDQDEAAIAGDYAGQDPARVAAEIPDRANALVAVLARYDEESLARAAVRSDGAAFTALSLGRYLIHDLAHHLHDVGATHD